MIHTISALPQDNKHLIPFPACMQRAQSTIQILFDQKFTVLNYRRHEAITVPLRFEPGKGFFFF